jgi:AcrR family transcriptional regulator
VRQSVLEATYRLLLSEGFAGLSIPAVADAAGVHETSIYRRWGEKASLVVDACLARATAAITTPDTGRLRDDLRQLASQVAALLSSHEGQALVQATLHTRDEPAKRAAQRRFWAERLEQAEPLFARASARGELRIGFDARLGVELLIGPLYFRALVSGEPLNDAYVDRIVDQLIDGLGPGSRQQRTSPKRGVGRSRRTRGRRSSEVSG